MGTTTAPGIRAVIASQIHCLDGEAERSFEVTVSKAGLANRGSRYAGFDLAVRQDLSPPIMKNLPQQGGVRQRPAEGWALVFSHQRRSGASSRLLKNEVGKPISYCSERRPFTACNGRLPFSPDGCTEPMTELPVREGLQITGAGRLVARLKNSRYIRRLIGARRKPVARFGLTTGYPAGKWTHRESSARHRQDERHSLMPGVQLPKGRFTRLVLIPYRR